MANWVKYNKGKKRQATDPIDWDNDVFKLIILKTAPSVDPVSAGSLGDTGLEFVSDLVPGTNEVVGTGYARPTCTITVTGPTSGVIAIDASNDPSFAQNAGGFGNGQYAVLFKDKGGADTANPILYAADFGAVFGNVAGPLTLTLNGIVDIS